MAAKSNHSSGPKSDNIEDVDSEGDVTSGKSPKYGHLIEDDDKSEGREIPETFRAYDTFPAGKECDLTVDEMPDDEEVFGWTKHYENESRKRSNPDVTEDVLDEILTEGVCCRAPGEDWDNRFLVQREIDGYEWTLVVADDFADLDFDQRPGDEGVSEGEEHCVRWVLITIYSNYHGSIGVTNKYFDRLKERRNRNS